MPTEKEIDAAMTDAGGWTRETLSAWGVPWPPPRGWKAIVIAGHSRYYAPGRMHPKQSFQMSMKKFGSRK